MRPGSFAWTRQRELRDISPYLRGRLSKIRIDYLSLHCQVAGVGPPLVLIHSLGRDLSTWSAQMPAFAGRYKVVAYDLRGSGQLDKGGGYSMASWVEDLRGLLGALEMAQAYLLGISMGGMIAMAFAVQYPHMAKALILANTSSRLSDQGLSLLNARAEMVEQYGMESILEASMAGSFSAGFIQSNEEIVGRERETIRRNDPQAFAATCRAIARVDLTSDLGRIACPTLIIAGEEDAAIPLDSVQALHRQIPLSHLKVLPHCGHLSHIEQPEAFNAAVLEFLAPLQG